LEKEQPDGCDAAGGTTLVAYGYTYAAAGRVSQEVSGKAVSRDD
jgi:hypothetical protein